MRRPKLALLSVLVMTVVGTAPAFAQGPRLDLSLPDLPEIGADPGASEVEARLEFLERRLEAAQFEGRLWYYGWLGVYAAGIAFNSTRAAITDDDDDRVAPIVNAGKSVVGITGLLLDPLPARLGADPIRAMPGDTPERERARLRAAEDLLERSAERAGRKFTIWPHLSNAALNLVGGGIILAFGDWEDAAVSTGLGLVVGEVRTFTVPSRPATDLAAYQGRFGPSPASGTGWYIAPRPNGIEIGFRF